MRTNDVRYGVRVCAGWISDQVDDPTAFVFVSLISDSEARSFKSSSDIGCGPVKTVTTQYGTLSYIGAEFADVTPEDFY